MSRSTRRWDSRAWLARVALAIVPVLALGTTPGSDLVPALAVVVLWIPAISVTQTWALRSGGTLQALTELLVDVLALSVLGLLVPGLGAPILVVLAAAGLVHATRLQGPARLAPVVAVVIGQVVVGSGEAAVFGGPLGVVTLDACLAAIGLLVLGEREADHQRSRAALDRADQLTDAVLAGIGEAVVVTDTTGRIVSTNAAAETTFGREVHGRCEWALGLQHGAARLDCSRGCPLLEGDTNGRQLDVHRQHPSGRRQSLLANVRALTTPTGRVREVVHSFRDVSSLKRAEEAKNLFLATASHELKTPVAVIAGFAELLQHPELSDDQRATALRTITNRAAQLSDVVERLLLSSRIQGGGIALETEAVDAMPILTERVEALRATTGRRIDLEAPEEVPAVDGDRPTIATIIDHLVENAVKYSPDGGPVVVAVRVEEQTIVVDVTDHGIGMSSDDAEECFTAFWQAEDTDTRRFGGSGVGLYIVRSLARALHGDTVVARSAPGEGTTFRWTMRRADTAPPETVASRPQTTVHDEVMRQVGVGGGG